MKTDVDGILDESWKTGDKVQDEWLSRPSNSAARASSSRFAKELASLDDLHSSIMGGPRTAPSQNTSNTVSSDPTELADGQSRYIGQNGKTFIDTSPQSGFVVGVGANGKPSYQFRIDGRAPIAKENGNFGLGLTPDAEWAGKFRSGPSAQRLQNNGLTVAPNRSDRAWAETFPGSHASTSFASVSPPLNAFSTTPGDARNIAQQYGGEQLKISDPRPTAKLEWPSLPPSPVDQDDRRKYR